jgi:hypothetical protein
MTDDPGTAEAEAEAEQQRAVRRQQAEWAQLQTEGLTDWELIGTAASNPAARNPMEMNRRLKVATERLTAELVAFSKSSDAAAGKLARLTRVIISLTVALVVLTVALVVLTVRGTPASPAPTPSRTARSVTPSRAPATAPASHSGKAARRR